MLYLSVCILGQTKRTKSVFASFPLALNERMYFERVRVNSNITCKCYNRKVLIDQRSLEFVAVVVIAWNQ